MQLQPYASGRPVPSCWAEFRRLQPCALSRHRLSSRQPAPLKSRHPQLPADAALWSIAATQGVMLDIVAMILIVTEENLPTGVLWTPWSDLFYALMFWFTFLLVAYCLFFNFL